MIGQLGFKTLVSILGVIIVGLAGFALINPSSLQGWIEGFCLENPVFCGGETQNIIKGPAFDSAKSLTCAVNSVANGEELGCVKELEENAPNGPHVQCSESKNLVCCDGGRFSGEYWMTPESCAQWGGESTAPTSDDKCGEVIGFKEKRPEGHFSCDVVNFNLPQEVSGLEYWIPDYGDPKYTIYWQSFPPEEDTWSLQIDWKIHAAFLAISVLPIGAVGKGAKTLIGGAGKAALEAGTSRAAVIGERLAQYSNKLTPAELATKTGAKAALKGAWGIIKGTPRTVKKIIGAGTISGALYLSEFIDSVLGKYDPHPGKIVLKIPFADPFLYEIDGWEGNPIFTLYRPRVLSSVTNAHFVSPCKIGALPVKKGAASCSSYSVTYSSQIEPIQAAFLPTLDANPEQDKIVCTEPKYLKDFASSSLPSCKESVGIKVSSNQSQDFVDYFKGFDKAAIPQFMQNYFDGEKATVFFSDKVKYQMTKSKDFSGDKLIIKTSEGEKEFTINLTTEGKDDLSTISGFIFGYGPAEGFVSYDGSKANIYKYCMTWFNENKQSEVFNDFVERGHFAQFRCEVGIHIESTCSSDSVCQELEKISLEEPYSGGFIGALTAVYYNVNKLAEFAYYKNVSLTAMLGSSASRREMSMGNWEYTVTLADVGFTDTFDSIVFHQDDMYWNNMQKTWNPKLIISDSNFDGFFDTRTTNDCKVEAIYVDMLEKQNKEGYCTSEHGPIKSSLENVGTYGGTVIGVVGLAVATFATAGTALAFWGGVAAYVGFAASGIAEFSDAMGTWPTP